MSTNCGAKVSKLCLVPQRWILGIMGSLAIVNAYTMRVSLSIAITEMVLPIAKADTGADTCPVPDGGNISSIYSVKDKSTQYDWDEQTQGLILSSFYWGYVITHIPGGMLAERFGGKHVLGLGILFTAICTLITPWFIKVTKGCWWALVLLRVIEGVGEGTTYPALSSLLGQWVPLEERSTIGTLVYSGSQVGTVFSNMVGGQLIYITQNWASVFYLFGGLGLLWCLLWQLLCYSYPETHPFISEKERTLLIEKLHNVQSGHRQIPWCPIFRSAPLWALVWAQIGHDWGFLTMVTDLPKYFKDVLKFRVGANGIWSSVPYVLMWIVSMFSGVLCDWMIKKYTSVTFARKLFTSIASLGPAVFIVVAAYMGCNRMASVGMFTIAMGFMGTFYCGMKVNALDLSPNYSGTLMAVVNGIGASTGIISPYVVGVITPDHTLYQWRIVFWITFGIFNFTNVIYLIWGSGEEQWWNDSSLFQKINTNINTN